MIKMSTEFFLEVNTAFYFVNIPWGNIGNDFMNVR